MIQRGIVLLTDSFTFADEADNKTTPGFKPAPVALPIADAKAAETGEGGSGGDGGGGGTTDATAAATTAPAAEGEGDCPKASPGSESPGRQGGTGKGGPEEEGGVKEQDDGGPKLSPPGVVSRAVEAPSSAASGRWVGKKACHAAVTGKCSVWKMWGGGKGVCVCTHIVRSYIRTCLCTHKYHNPTYETLFLPLTRDFWRRCRT